MALAEQVARAQVYRDAAGEHITVAQELYNAGRYVLANYLAGLSVECMLRAYRHMVDPNFDSRHDLDRLYSVARFADATPKRHIESITAALGTVMLLWSNDHRFLTLSALRKRWAERGLFKGIRGNFEKELVRRTVNAAEQIVAIGAARWKSSFES
jgi:hypothetical protein